MALPNRSTAKFRLASVKRLGYRLSKKAVAAKPRDSSEARSLMRPLSTKKGSFGLEIDTLSQRSPRKRWVLEAQSILVEDL